jgi:hypothetical protein
MTYKKVLSSLLFIFFSASVMANENGVRTIPLKGTVALTFDDGSTEPKYIYRN